MESLAQLIVGLIILAVMLGLALLCLSIVWGIVSDVQVWQMTLLVLGGVAFVIGVVGFACGAGNQSKEAYRGLLFAFWGGLAAVIAAYIIAGVRDRFR